MHEYAPAAEYSPALHSVHSVAAPTLKLPAAHDEQDVEFCVIEYFPLGHAKDVVYARKGL